MIAEVLELGGPGAVDIAGVSVASTGCELVGLTLSDAGGMEENKEG